ncbi:unnamed protein product [Musa acuminata var. zebrina]
MVAIALGSRPQAEENEAVNDITGPPILTHLIDDRSCQTSRLHRIGGDRIMEAGKAKQQQQRERRTSNGIIIEVYEEAPPRPGANRPIQRRSRLGAPSSLAYDRRKMLLAYSQQLRQCHEQPTQGCCKIVHRPSWGQWKAAFLRNHGGVNEEEEFFATANSGVDSSNSDQNQKATKGVQRCRACCRTLSFMFLPRNVEVPTGKAFVVVEASQW